MGERIVLLSGEREISFVCPLELPVEQKTEDELLTQVKAEAVTAEVPVFQPESVLESSVSTDIQVLVKNDFFPRREGRVGRALTKERTNAEDTRAFSQKEVRLITDKPNKPARLKVCAFSDLNETISETYSFILEGASESFKSRFELFSTRGGDYLDFFGEETMVWSYTGTTLNANVYANFENKNKGNASGSTHTNWYSDFSKFVINNIGLPAGDEDNLVVVLEYDDLVRVGYLLAFDVSRQSQMKNLVSFSFSLAIKDFFSYT